MSSPGKTPSSVGKGGRPPVPPTPTSMTKLEHSPGLLMSPVPHSRSGDLLGRAAGTPSNASTSMGMTNSPFREWATSNLGAFGNEIVWPANASRSILSPSYPHMRVRIESENSPLAVGVREGDIGHSMHVETSSPTLALDKVFQEQQDGGSAKKVEVPMGDISKRLPKLAMSEEIAFEMQKGDNKVVTKGFANPPTVSTRSKRPIVPPTPSVPAAFASPAALENMAAQEPHDGRRRVCCCKKSKCLKLYCECFSAGVMCSTCKCLECANDGNHEDERLHAVKSIKQRNVNAFAPKIVDDQAIENQKHARGCRCKKSHCLKKYCECFAAGVECTDKCKCEQCQNRHDFDGTPRDRPEDAVRVHPPSAGSEMDDEEHCDDSSSLSPRRNKRPRCLDFNINTPHQATLQESPMQGSSQALRSSGGLSMSFGSPPLGLSHQPPTSVSR